MTDVREKTRQGKNRAQSLKDALTEYCRIFDLSGASKVLKQIKLRNYDWGHYVTTIYDDFGLSWSQKEQLLALFVDYRSDEEDALVANLWYTLSNYNASTATKEDDDELTEIEDLDLEQLQIGNSLESDDVLDERSRMGWQEYIGRQLCQKYPRLASQKGISREVQTILELAIGHEAYWVIPDVNENGKYHEQAVSEDLKDVLRKGVISLAVQIGNVETIKRLVALYKYFDIEPAEDEFILQNAVLKKNGAVVDLLLEAFEGLVMQRRNGKSVLEELRPLGHFEDKAHIEQSLVSKIVRLQDIALSRQLLYDSSSKLATGSDIKILMSGRHT
jgi:hypothetical protein